MASHWHTTQRAKFRSGSIRLTAIPPYAHEPTLRAKSRTTCRADTSRRQRRSRSQVGVEPFLNGGPPESNPTTTPVVSNAIPTRTDATIRAVMPSRPNRYGSTGMIAPEAKKQKLAAAAPQPGSDGFMVVDNVRGAEGAVREDLGGALVRFLGGHTAGPVDQGQFVRVDVEQADSFAGSRTRIGRFPTTLAASGLKRTRRRPSTGRRPEARPCR